MKLKAGDVLFEPLSNNVGEITEIIDHPDGKLVKIRWRVEDHLHHETEHFQKKVLKCIRKGDFEYTPKSDP